MNDELDISYDPITGQPRAVRRKKEVVKEIVRGRGGGGTPGTVKVSENDNVAGFLNGKLVAGSNITLTEDGDGNDETLTIATTAANDWGDITGDIEDQADLQTALRQKKNLHYVENLRGWNMAVSSKATAPARIVLLGDSIIELFNGIYAQKINSNYNTYASSYFRAAGAGVGFSPWSTWTGTKDTDHGLGSRGGTLDVGEEGTLSNSCDGFIVSYDVQETGGADLEIYIDAVLVDTISTTDASVDTIESGRLWTSSALAYTTHTLRVVAAGSGTAKVGGAFFSAGNLTTGVQVWGAGHSGWDSTNFVNDESTFEAINTLDPDLVVVMLGINDYTEGAAVLETNLTTIVQRLKTDTPLTSILIVAQFGTLDRADWQDFVDACRNVAIAEETAFLDLFESMGGLGTTDDVYGISDDGVHPNAKGQGILTSSVSDAIYTPLVHPSSPPLRADGATIATGAQTWNFGTGGVISLATVFGLPILLLYSDSGDTQPSLVFGGGGLQFGVGGTTAPDITLQRSAADILAMGSGDKIQQNAAPTVGDDLVNKTYADTKLASSAYDDATAAETTTGASTAKYVSPDALAGSDYGIRLVQIQVTDPNGAALATGDGQAYFSVPAQVNGYNLVSAQAHVTTVSSSGTPTVQIHNVTQAADMLSTRITIDANEKDSVTAATPPVIDTGNDDVATGDELRIDVDVAGTGTKGLQIRLGFQLP